jgi:hypothetical protein
VFIVSFKENNRSRLNSASSDISQVSVNQSYVSPPRNYRPPSDIESEYGGDESDHESNTVRLLNILVSFFSIVDFCRK